MYELFSYLSRFEDIASKVIIAMGSGHHPSVIYDSCSTKVVILVLESKVENKIVINLIVVLSQAKDILLNDCYILFIFFRNFILHGLTIRIPTVFLTINFCKQFESPTVKVIFLVV